jgi:hypothetical protein
MRNFAAAILLFFALFGLPKVGNDSGPTPSPVAPTISVPEPTKDMKDAVSKVAGVLKSASVVDRMLWAQIWTKAAKAVEKDSTDDKVVWSDTNSLRKLTETALRIGWRRLGGNQSGKYPGLSESVESAFSAILTTRVQAVTPELRKKYVDLCNAIAWAGLGRDQ